MEIRSLTVHEDQARLEAIALAVDYLDSDPPFSAQQSQILYDVIAANYFEYEKAQVAVGIVFGEMIVAKAGYDWVRAIDEYGEENALCHNRSSVLCFPISMIQKRLLRNEAVKLVDLCASTIAEVEKAANSGNYPPRSF